MMKKVYVCSPLGGNVSENIENAKVYSRGSTGYFIASWLTYGFYYGFSLLPALTSCVVSNP